MMCQTLHFQSKKYKPNAVRFRILSQAYFLCAFYSLNVKWSPQKLIKNSCRCYGISFAPFYFKQILLTIHMKRKWTANPTGYFCRLQAKHAQTAHVRHKVGLGVIFLKNIPLPPSSPPFFPPMQIDIFLHNIILKFHPSLTFLNGETLHPGQQEAL